MDESGQGGLPEYLNYNPTFEIWKEQAGISNPGELSYNLSLYSKILGIFNSSDFCYLIFNLHDVSIEWCSKGVKKLFGLEADEFQPIQFFSLLHPDDVPTYQKREGLVTDFFRSLPKERIFKYKQRHDFRVVLKDGSSKRILQQVIALQVGEDREIQRSLVSFTDVDFLEEGFVSGLSFIGLDGEPSYYHIDSENGWEESVNPLSVRENEILILLSQELDTAQIAEILGLSPETVKRHRKNMLARTKCRDTNELVLMALRKCWI